jgi:nucleoside-diphosphate-sugar epimerase
LKKKHVLVTGGCGFIGINLVEDLLAQGDVVTVLDLPSANWDRLPKQVRKVQADILSQKSLDGLFKEIDIIYHLAARTDLDGRNIDDYKVNFEGTENILKEVAKSSNVKRFIFYSTQLVVGLFNETRFINEEEPYKTKTVYGESKILGEKVVKKLCSESGTDFVIIRPTSVYGPWVSSPYK